MTSTTLDRTVVSIPTIKKRHRPKHLLLAGAALLIAAGAAWYGQHWWSTGRFIESTDDAYVGGDITVIAPKVAGFIAEVAVTDNQTVRAGDLLVKLDAGDDKARAAVTAAERELDVIDTQKQQTEADLAVAIADRDTARLNLGYTELRAPVDGIVGNRSARRGAYAPVGAQLISLVPTRG